MEREFSAKLVASGDPTYAAEKAGYAYPKQAGYKLAHNPDVAEDARRRARQMLMTKGAEVGVRVLLELAEDTKQKGSTRGAAAKSLVQLSGISNAQTLSEADLAELPADKIRALLAEAQRALEARMKTVQGRVLEGESAQAAPNIYD